MAPLRAALAMQNLPTSETKYTDEQVRLAAGVPPVQALVYKRLVGYLIRVVVNEHVVVRRLIALVAHSSGTWGDMLKGALWSPWASSEALRGSMPDPSTHVNEWLNSIS
eukprot:11225100-Lingulodinium_polyedra.AAC.1